MKYITVGEFLDELLERDWVAGVQAQIILGEAMKEQELLDLRKRRLRRMTFITLMEAFEGHLWATLASIEQGCQRLRLSKDEARHHELAAISDAFEGFLMKVFDVAESLDVPTDWAKEAVSAMMTLVAVKKAYLAIREDVLRDELFRMLGLDQTFH